MLDCYTILLVASSDLTHSFPPQVTCYCGLLGSCSGEETKGRDVVLDVDCHPPCLLPALGLRPALKCSGLRLCGGPLSCAWASILGVLGLSPLS